MRKPSTVSPSWYRCSGFPSWLGGQRPRAPQCWMRRRTLRSQLSPCLWVSGQPLVGEDRPSPSPRHRWSLWFAAPPPHLSRNPSTMWSAWRSHSWSFRCRSGQRAGAWNQLFLWPCHQRCSSKKNFEAWLRSLCLLVMGRFGPHRSWVLRSRRPARFLPFWNQVERQEGNLRWQGIERSSFAVLFTPPVVAVVAAAVVVVA